MYKECVVWTFCVGNLNPLSDFPSPIPSRSWDPILPLVSVLIVWYPGLEMGGNQSMPQTPLDCTLKYMKKPFEEAYETGSFKPGRLRYFCQNDWPTFGLDWPEIGSFDLELAAAVMRRVTSPPDHPDQFPYIDIWVSLLRQEPPPPWLKRCKEEHSRVLFARLKVSLKEKSEPEEKPIYTEPDQDVLPPPYQIPIPRCLHPLPDIPVISENQPTIQTQGGQPVTQPSSLKVPSHPTVMSRPVIGTTGPTMTFLPGFSPRFSPSVLPPPPSDWLNSANVPDDQRHPGSASSLPTLPASYPLTVQVQDQSLTHTPGTLTPPESPEKPSELTGEDLINFNQSPVVSTTRSMGPNPPSLYITPPLQEMLKRLHS